MKKFGINQLTSFLLLFLFISFFYYSAGCVGNDSGCKKPFISYKNICCLDENDNRICDSNEGKDKKAEIESQVEQKITKTTLPPSGLDSITAKEEKSTTVTSTTIIATTTTLKGVECIMNSDCGTNGTKTLDDYYCLDSKTIAKRFWKYRCKGSGTKESVCIPRPDFEILRFCLNSETCIKGVPYCRYSGNGRVSALGYSIPKNVTFLEINEKSMRYYEGKRYQADYALSDEGSIVGLMLRINTSVDGGVVEKYTLLNNPLEFDYFRIGVKKIYQIDDEINATIWIKGLPKSPSKTSTGSKNSGGVNKTQSSEPKKEAKKNS